MRSKYSLTLAMLLCGTAGAYAGEGELPPTSEVTVEPLFQNAPVISCDSGSVCRDGCTLSETDCNRGDSWNLRFFGEAGINLVRPVQHGPVMVLSRPVGNAFGPAGLVNTKFRYPLQAGPRITLGAVTENGYGMMMSWWGFEDGSRTDTARNTSAVAGLNFASAPIPGIPGFFSPSPAGTATGVVNDAMSFTSRVRMYVFDWDWFFDSKCLGWNARTTFGARYAYISQDYQAMRVNTGTGAGGALTADNDFITAGHNFSGIGPTTAMIVRRPIGNTNWHLFFSDRLSVLFGPSHGRAVQVSQLAGTIGGVPVNTTTVSTSGQDISVCVPNEDIEAGFEWARDVGDSLIFFRTAFIDQTFFDAGNATSLHGNLTIVGMSIVGGIRY